MDFTNTKSKDRTLSSRKHNQIIHFDNKTKATILNIVKVYQDTMVHIVTEDGRDYIINQDRVLYTEIIWL